MCTGQKYFLCLEAVPGLLDVKTRDVWSCTHYWNALAKLLPTAELVCSAQEWVLIQHFVCQGDTLKLLSFFIPVLFWFFFWGGQQFFWLWSHAEVQHKNRENGDCTVSQALLKPPSTQPLLCWSADFSNSPQRNSVVELEGAHSGLLITFCMIH